uniref:Uncharacterized protein n=1 Tax=Amphimedon queenslandica TaxID=400682 RepID=A0A1X7VAP5_AMPQE
WAASIVPVTKPDGSEEYVFNVTEVGSSSGRGLSDLNTSTEIIDSDAPVSSSIETDLSLMSRSTLYESVADDALVNSE